MLDIVDNMLKGVRITLSTLIGVECCCAINYQILWFYQACFFVRVGLLQFKFSFRLEL